MTDCVKETIKKRRAYRALKPFKADEKLVFDLAESAALAPSCYNNQPWRFVFVKDKDKLIQMRQAFSEGNRWAWEASMIIAVFSRKEDDCVIKDRQYHQFDVGMAAAHIILRATEIGLVAHPIAGFSPKKTRQILKIPEEYQVITLVLVGAHDKNMPAFLSEKQRESENRRPERENFGEYAAIDEYS